MIEAIIVVPSRGSWAIKHNGGFLGYADSQAQALVVAQDLIEWLRGQGRAAELLVERSPGRSAAQGLHQ